MGYKEEKDYDFSDVEDTSILKEDFFLPSTLETIDESLFRFVDERLNIFVRTNKGFEKVPVIWSSAERSFHVKNNTSLRDNDGTFILPAISISRTSMEKSLARKGGVFGNALAQDDVKGGVVVIGRRINQDKTSNFANADSSHRFGQTNFPSTNKKVVYETATIPIPVYVDVTYDIVIRTEYQQQINTILTKFLNVGNGINYFNLYNNGHTYEGFMEASLSDASTASDPSDDEQYFETNISIKVLGYLLGEEKNDERPKIVYRQNAVEFKLGRERLIVGDQKPWLSKDNSDYRD